MGVEGEFIHMKIELQTDQLLILQSHFTKISEPSNEGERLVGLITWVSQSDANKWNKDCQLNKSSSVEMTVLAQLIHCVKGQPFTATNVGQRSQSNIVLPFVASELDFAICKAELAEEEGIVNATLSDSMVKRRFDILEENHNNIVINTLIKEGKKDSLLKIIECDSSGKSAEIDLLNRNHFHTQNGESLAANENIKFEETTALHCEFEAKLEPIFSGTYDEKEIDYKIVYSDDGGCWQDSSENSIIEKDVDFGLTLKKRQSITPVAKQQIISEPNVGLIDCIPKNEVQFPVQWVADTKTKKEKNNSTDDPIKYIVPKVNVKKEEGVFENTFMNVEKDIVRKVFLKTENDDILINIEDLKGETTVKNENGEPFIDLETKSFCINSEKIKSSVTKQPQEFTPNQFSKNKATHESQSFDTLPEEASLKMEINRNSRLDQKRCTNCEMQFEEDYELKKHNCDSDNKWQPTSDNSIQRVDFKHNTSLKNMPKRCKEQTTLQSDLKKIRQTDLNKNSKDKFSCEFVQDVTKRYEEVKYSKEKPFCCDVCNKRYCQMSNLVSHKRTHAKEKPYCCNVCNKRFSQSNTLVSHKRTHTKEKPFCCDVCNKRFTERSTLVSHKRTHTKEKPFCCDVCDERFSQMCSLVRHKRTHTKEKPFLCGVCNKRFSHSNTLVSHKRTHTKEKPFCCNVCNKRFSIKSNLASHKRTHSKEKPFSCDVCNKRFSVKCNLVSHKTTHSKEKPFCCNVCNKRFFVKSNLVSHKITHSKEKPFCCDVCNKRFSQMSYLLRHKRTHSKEKPFCCDVCNKRFSHSYTLVIHKRTHTKEKPFCCDVCNKRFTERSTLINHIRTHTKEKPFCCDVCNNRFSQMGTLVSHKRTHTKEKPFTCNVCNKSFSSKSYLKTHIEMHFTC